MNFESNDRFIGVVVSAASSNEEADELIAECVDVSTINDESPDMQIKDCMTPDWLDLVRMQDDVFFFCSGVAMGIQTNEGYLYILFYIDLFPP